MTKPTPQGTTEVRELPKHTFMAAGSYDQFQPPAAPCIHCGLLIAAAVHAPKRQSK